MYSVYNKNYNYVYLFANRVASHTQRKFYIELHRDEFTDIEYNLLETTTLFNKELLYKFPSHQNERCSKIYLSRNPYTRAVSTYSLYLSKNTKYFSENVKVQAKDFYDKNTEHSFLNFLKYVNTNYISDVHILPQSINYDKYSKNIVLGKLSNPKNVLYDFYKKIQFDMTYFDKVYSNVFSKKLHKSHLGLSIENLITDETENYIYKFYKKDFDLFGYDRYKFTDNFTHLI